MDIVPIRTFARVITNDTVMPGVHLLWLEEPRVAAQARPGQFVMLKCQNGTFLRRPLSIHRLSADKTRLAFLFASVGRGTAWLATLEAGDYIDLLGPLGNGFDPSPGLRRAVLIAGGLGVAPLGFLADELIARGTQVSFAYGAATSALLCPDRLLPEGAEYVFITEDGSRGRPGFVTAHLPALFKEGSELFACGPTPMYRALASLDECKKLQIQVSLEIRMACALGVCYGCTINTDKGLQQVCRHGPVFNIHSVLWDEFPDI
ncbi:MAG: dihydroorotate dehydrogenase electron transfer subunit [Dehalococcoidia bacterium]|nr:dihydroorotate dehydrogenase electron transfer subunit [Dehalococcoidia bacterium]